MRALLTACSIALLILANESYSQTQPSMQLRGPGPIIGGFNLIAMPEVQRELKFEAKQVAKAQEVARRMNARYAKDIGQMKGLNTDEQAKRAVTLAGPHYEEGMRELKTFLSPTQVDRYDQILFQQRIPMVMLEPTIAPMLKITNDQAKQVVSLVADAMNEQKALLKTGASGQKTASPQMEAIANRAKGQAVALLSPEQRKIWDQLTGVPFKPDASADSSSERASEPRN